MRESTKWVVLTLAVVTGFSFGQSSDKPPADKAESTKRSLDELINAALRHSPDVQVADAKVREAQAQLRRERLALVQKVIDANSSVEAARADAQLAEKEFKRIAVLHNTAGVDEATFQSAEARFATAKALLARAETALNLMTGKFPADIKGVTAVENNPPSGAAPAGISGTISPSGFGGFTGSSGIAGNLGGGIAGNMGGGIAGFSGGIGGIGGALGIGGGIGGGVLGGGGPEIPPPLLPQSKMSERLHAALDGKIKVEPVNNVPLGDVLKKYRTAAGVPFLLHLGEKAAEPINLSLDGEVQLGAALQALEDVVPGLRCFVREYGILVTLDETAPERAMPLVEFWHRKPGAK
ncbi:MAG TPA: hypothetical protein VH120_20960 [Gemmataceae bacterium]|nr:hypothetical protein [Gemmataceae bacterium]